MRRRSRAMMSSSSSRQMRVARAHPRSVLLGAVSFVFFMAVFYYIAPWVLPVRVVEGPLVQMSTPGAASIIWYTTRPAECVLVMEQEGSERTYAASAEGRRHRVRVEGLEPNSAYPYEIRIGERVLAAYTLRSNRSADQPFSFAVLGDSGKGTRAQYFVGREMAEVRPDFVLHTGDVVYSRGQRYHYRERFFAPYAALLGEVSFWPSIGNHDLDDDDPHEAQGYMEVFELPPNGPPGLPPKYHYWFDYADARVVVLDSDAFKRGDDVSSLGAELVTWMRQVFADCPYTWRFAAFHHPPYTGGKYAPDAVIQEALVPVFEEVGIDVVFNGHDHNYQRTYPLRGGEVVEPGEGVVYVVTGAGGARLYAAKPTEQRPAYIAALNDEVHSFTHVAIFGRELQLRQISADGEVLDEWDFVKPPAVGAASEGEDVSGEAP